MRNYFLFLHAYRSTIANSFTLASKEKTALTFRQLKEEYDEWN